MLASRHALHDWLIFQNENNFEVSFCRAFYYSRNNENLIIMNGGINPRLPNLYKKSLSRDFMCKLYFVVYDPILGASTLVKRDIFEKYLREIKDKVILTEDSIYALMLIDGIRIGFFDDECIWYEANTGITAKNNRNSDRILFNDYKNMLSLSENRLSNERLFDKKLR